MPASLETTEYAPDNLIAGHQPVASRKVTLLSGENRTRGAVLGKISIGGAASAAKAGGNTGAGTLTLDATTPVRPGAKVGVYTVRCIAAATDGGTFRVEDPDGNVLGDVLVGATFDDDIKFAIADGNPDFIVGDGFDITVSAGSGKYKLAAAAAIDGSAVPDAILAEDRDATSADAECLIYTRGDFNQDALVLGSGLTVAGIREGLREKGINLVKVQQH